MIRKTRNIMEDIVQKHMDEMLIKYPRICKCEKCCDNIAVYVLNRIPAQYVTTESGAMYALSEKIQVEELSKILKLLVEAISAFGRAPNHR
ncbi:MAG: late competence development ComFB family protein [Candidatus Omnitrophica bacterium]|nr:late competence development ComFB family protein [Candidatus Omnitrophota bacterium]